MKNTHQQTWIQRAGCAMSSWVSDLAADPLAQVAFIVVCAAWFWVGFATDLLTALLSIMAITLTQMVLNRQNEREHEDHRRDVAMHAKLDELISATKRARNELVGVEDREEDEIVQLKEEVKEALEQTVDADPDTRETAKEAVEVAAQELKQDLREKQGRATTKPRKAAAMVKR
jgi:low affinity Fe/Cu permease